MRQDEGLHRHGILFHDVADHRVGVDDDLVGQALQTLAVERLVVGKALAEAPVPVHQRQADRGIGIEHLLGGDDLDLHRVDVEPEVVERDPLDRLIGSAQRPEIPIGASEQRHVRSQLCNVETRVKHGRPLLQTIRGTPRRSAPDRRPAASRNVDAPAPLRYRPATNRCRATAR